MVCRAKFWKFQEIQRNIAILYAGNRTLQVLPRRTIPDSIHWYFLQIMRKNIDFAGDIPRIRATLLKFNDKGQNFS